MEFLVRSPKCVTSFLLSSPVRAGPSIYDQGAASRPTGTAHSQSTWSVCKNAGGQTARATKPAAPSPLGLLLQLRPFALWQKALLRSNVQVWRIKPTTLIRFELVFFAFLSNSSQSLLFRPFLRAAGNAKPSVDSLQISRQLFSRLLSPFPSILFVCRRQDNSRSSSRGRGAAFKLANLLPAALLHLTLSLSLPGMLSVCLSVRLSPAPSALSTQCR
jgi:hypothetical protein